MLWDTRVHDGDQWKTPSEISMHLVWATKEPKAIADQPNTDQPNNRSLSMSTTRQNYKRINHLQKFHDNRSNNNTFPTGTLSFQALQHINSGNNISFRINTIK